MNIIRRLPVYLIIDCSESMAGPAFEAVQNGLSVMLNELRGDPNALETVWLSIITFSHRAKVLVPLTDICEFNNPQLTLGSGTSLGVALALLAERLKAEVVLQTAERKGDWKPIVFIMTDGDPTDTWFAVADNFKSSITSKRANVIAVACGPHVNISNLKRVTPTVLAFKNPKEPSFKEFFKWISQSVQTTSARLVSKKDEGITLPDLPSTMEMAAEGLQVPIQRYVFLLCRCGESKGLYVARYEKVPAEVLQDLRQSKGLDLPLHQDYYFGAASHPVADFEFTAGKDELKLSISSDSLLSPPACPYCRNESLASCGRCHGLFCIAKSGTHQCPWCEDTGTYHTPEKAFDVGRGLG